MSLQRRGVYYRAGTEEAVPNVPRGLPGTIGGGSPPKTWVRPAFSIGAAAAVLAGCGGLQLSPPPPVNQVASQPQRAARTSGAYKLLYSFKGSEDGKEPTAGMVNVGGTFYGTTNIGGNPACYGKVAGCGTVFTITTEGHEHVLYRFRPPPSGDNPLGSGLIRVGDEFYGVTAGGEIECGSGCGTVFKLSPSGREQTLYRFKGNGADGIQPMASLVYVKGKLYGTTNGGGNPHHLGTVFEVTLSGSERVLHSFQGSRDGENPSTALINVNGTLYGTTGSGGGARWCHKNLGTDGCGTVFSITTSGQEHIIYRFKGGRDGAIPSDSLTDIDGSFYGTTASGGSSGCTGGCGTVFELKPTSGQVHIIYRFKGGTDGYNPSSDLLYYRGMLYGTTPVAF